VYSSQTIGWSDTLSALESGGEPPSRIASRGSTCQAPESCGSRCCRANAGNGVKVTVESCWCGTAKVSWPWCGVTHSFKAKLNAHSTCAQESCLHTYRTDNGH
jgi:hypothetical protein